MKPNQVFTAEDRQINVGITMDETLFSDGAEKAAKNQKRLQVM